jgi:hypothetical protein
MYFNPSAFADDIVVKRLRGKGRGKGFAISEEYSILNDNPTIGKVRDRVLSIIRLLMAEGLVTEDYVMKSLGITTSTDVVPVYLPQGRDTDLEEAAEKVEAMVYDAMGLDKDDIDTNEDIAIRLNAAATKLVNDYLEYRELDEESG